MIQILGKEPSAAYQGVDTASGPPATWDADAKDGLCRTRPSQRRDRTSVLRKEHRCRFHGISREGAAGEMLRLRRFFLLPFLYGGKLQLRGPAEDSTHVDAFQTFGQVVLEALAFGLVSALPRLRIFDSDTIVLAGGWPGCRWHSGSGEAGLDWLPTAASRSQRHILEARLVFHHARLARSV